MSDDRRAKSRRMVDGVTPSPRRFEALGIFGYTIETIVAATNREADRYNLPAGCVQLLGY